MKQTNNAIKFLMAQYRAIFQNAYFKGLATAAVVTAGLAAGQAQAAAITPDNWSTLTGEQKVEKTETFAFSGAANGTNTNITKLTITSTGNHEIKSGSVVATNAEFIYNATGGKFDIKADKSTAGSLEVKKFDLKQGKVIIAGQDSALKARTLNVGDGTGNAETSSIEVGTTSVLGDELSEAAADTLTNIVVNSDGVITNTKASGTSEEVTIHAATLNINGGKIVNVDPDSSADANNTTLTINLSEGSLSNKGAIEVAANGTVALTFDDTAITKSSTDTTKLKKEFNVGEGTLDVKGKLVVSGAAAAPATLKLATNTTVQGSGELIVSGAGTILEADLATVNKAAKGAKLNISGGALDLGDSAVDLTANATDTNKLILNDSTADVSTGQIKFTNGSTLKAGAITFDADRNAKLFADTLTITSGNGTALNIENAVLSANSGLTIDANTVLKNDANLGTDSIAEINGKKGFTSLEDADKIKALLAHTGTISKGTNVASALTVENDKSLKIDNGSWTNDVALTLGTDSKKGSLVIGKADTNNTAASLKFNAGSKLILTSGDITVGAGTPQKLLQATLDFSELEADNFVIGKDNASTMTAENKGTIIISEDIANKIVAAENEKLKTIVNAGGTLKVDGNLSLAGAKLKKTGGNAGDIQLAGTLQANELTITGLNTELELGTATILAETLKLDGTTEGGTKLGSGNFVANTTLTATANDTTLTVGKGANVKLGNIIDGVAQSQGGAVELNLDVNAADTKNGTVTVATGNWTGKNVTLTKSGDFVVGGQDLKDNAKSVASFNAADSTLKIVDENSTVTIAKDSSATFAQLDQANGTINVSGTLTLTGKESGKATSGDLSYGVVTKAGDIKVDGADAVLHFGETAVKAITFSGDSIKYDAAKLAEDDPFANNVTLSNFGTLKLDFAKDTKLTKDQIKALRTEFLKNQDGNGYLDLTNVTISDVNVTQNADKGNRYEITYEELQNVGDLSESVVVENLKDATVTGIEAGNAVQGVVGNLEGKGTTSEITIAGATLNKGENGFANNQSGTTVNMTVNQGGFLHLKNGGTANKITLAAGADADNQTKLIITDGKNTIDEVAGKTNTSLQINGNTTNVAINKGLAVGSIETAAGSSLTVGKNASFKGDAKLAGDTSITGTLTVDGAFEASGNLNVSGASTFKGKATLSGAKNSLGDVTFTEAGNKIAQGQTFASDIKLGNDVNLVVGTEPVQGNAALANGASATLVTNKLSLNDGDLYIDPNYNVASSIVIANELSNANQANLKTDAGSLGGSVVALQNSIFAVGLDTTDKAAALAAVKSELAPLFKANGALDESKIGAVAYISKKITLGATDQLVVDSSKSLTAFNNADQSYKDIVTTNDIVLGANSALAIDGKAFEGTQAPITLQANSAVYAGKDAKILLTGSNVVAQVKGKKLFDGTGLTLNSVTLDTDNNKVLRVETINGWFTQNLTNFSTTLALTVNDQKMKGDLAGVSAPVADTLMSVAYGHKNYEAVKADPSVKADTVYGIAAGLYKNPDDGKFYNDTNFTQLVDTTNLTEQLKNHQVDENNAVYFAPENELIDNIVYNNGSAVDAETNARLAVFGGAPQAAIEAGASTYEAISARMGVGVSGVSAAANGQGGAIWVTPVYKSADADGFNADNKSYGADVKLYGLALGADIEVAPNFKVGGMFNVGSGDADGQGLGSNVSNDFDYYGLGLYAGYSMDAFSLVADVTYTAVDNDIEGNTDLGKVNASIDSTNLSVGVTGQYKLSLSGMDVTPHAGLRYSMIDMDDYATAYSQNDSDSINIFSLPVGVTIAKEYVTDTWTVKPSFDLTLTGNFGDDEAESTAKWNGFSNLSTTVKSEIMDNFTYGAAVGLSATSGNFGLGLGVNYTGSSNTDEFGVNANARYMF
ncbi:autotransporter domain-containing protein [Anaerobiospirillum sp. NML120448]|uniref:autotransporter domain-containing protein n=1 Tax=Anaerobiospirillum sp. NML120448 TaxID=2932816 RepID=UPI001FF29894|nr:autotransporter domain-containing protein [Anaerobiospirillum sp. NML120448]MCK0515072.1 autotransporter domain-containing protein [Anaerobiospirillum sp. NML120448]